MKTFIVKSLLTSLCQREGMSPSFLKGGERGITKQNLIPRLDPPIKSEDVIRKTLNCPVKPDNDKLFKNSVVLHNSCYSSIHLISNKILCLLFICILFMAIGCGGGSGSGGGSATSKDVSQITISASFKDVFATGMKAKATTLTQIRYRVSGAGMETINGIVPISNNLVEFQLKVPNGPQRHFIIEALDKDNRVRYAGDARRDLTGEPVVIEITLINNLIIGTWGYVRLHHENTGEWSTKSGKITFNIDGSGLDAYQYSDSMGTGTLNEIFTFTTTPNQDGSLTVNYTMAGGFKKTRRYIISDDAQMMVMDGTDEQERQRMRIFIRMDPSKTYTNANLQGEAYGIGYAYDMDKTLWPVQYVAWSGIKSFDGTGNCPFEITSNNEGTIMTGNFQDTYTLSSDGSIVFNNTKFTGYIGANDNLRIFSHVTSNNFWDILFGMKKGDRTYSTSDLAGTWVVVGFGRNSIAGKQFSQIAFWTCNSSGECALSIKRLIGSNIVYVSTNFSFSVLPDGSFGASLETGIPSYAAAIGNDGNTIIINRSFHQSSLQDGIMLVLTGVRCSNCLNVTGLTGLSGNWLFYRTPQGVAEIGPSCEMITQTIGTGDSFAVSGEFNGSGSINGDQVQITLNVDCGDKGTATLSGTTDGNTMNGKYLLKCGGVGESGTWRALRGECPP
jgi:hypothetical protein